MGVVRFVLAILLVACADPAPVVEEEEAPVLRPVESYPQEAQGCYRCDVTSIFYRADDAEPTEDERSGAAMTLGSIMLPDAERASVTATIEGCPFYVVRTPERNPQAFALGPAQCDGTRYHDGFLIIRGEVMRGEHIFRSLPSGEMVDCAPIGEGECETWERTEWIVTAQITGRERNGRHAIHTYLCMGEPCLR